VSKWIGRDELYVWCHTSDTKPEFALRSMDVEVSDELAARLEAAMRDFLAVVEEIDDVARRAER